MNKKELVELITRQVYEALSDIEKEEQGTIDISSEEFRKKIKVQKASNMKVMERLEESTPARIGIGKAGPRLTARSLISLRADHACAKDAVSARPRKDIIETLNLFTIKSMCRNIDEHLRRPDLGRQIDSDSEKLLNKLCIKNPQVQIYVSDGLSGSAVDSNIGDLLPIIIDGLNNSDIKTGTPFYMEFGRVRAMDRISELLNAEVTCVLLGERPGLVAADSMSAYIAYRAHTGMSESKRTVVSNIHEAGIQPVEAGAHIVDVIKTILARKASGVDLIL